MLVSLLHPNVNKSSVADIEHSNQLYLLTLKLSTSTYFWMRILHGHEKPVAAPFFKCSSFDKSFNPVQ